MNINDFFADFIVGVSSVLITIYIFNKSQNLTRKLSARSVVTLCVCSIILGALYAFIDIFSYALSQISIFFLPLLYLAIFERKRRALDAAIGFISTSLMHVLKLAAAIIIAFSFSFLRIPPIGIIANAASCLLTFIISILFMKVKRLKRGFLFFQSNNHLGLGLTLSGMIFVLTSVGYSGFSDEDIFYLVVIFGIIISGFGLYLWIRRSITAHYRERLQLKSEEHYRELLGKSEAENQALIRSNEFLAKVVHRDNHLISSLSSSIDAYFESPDKAFKDELLRGIQTLAKERSELIDREQLESKLLPATGSPMLDGAINELYIKASAHGIDFNLNVSAAPDEIIGKYISLTELQTLLCDHIKDAIIAVDEKGDERGKILVNLSMNNGCYEIGIFDSGVDFEIETLSKLGIERSTTHPDSGGSGIGFMTTFETLRRAYSSLIITELENKSPFSKSVVFRFDGENSFVIKSPRAEELREKINRKDVTII